MTNDAGERAENTSRIRISLCLSLSLHFLLICCATSLCRGTKEVPLERPRDGRSRFLSVSLASGAKTSNSPDISGALSARQDSPTPEQDFTKVGNAVLSSQNLSVHRQNGIDSERLPEQFARRITTDRAQKYYLPTDSLEVKPELMQLPEVILRKLEMGEQLDVLFYISASGEVDLAEFLGVIGGTESPRVEESFQFPGRYFSPGRVAGEAVAVKMLIRFNATDGEMQSNLAGQAPIGLPDKKVKLQMSK